MIERYYSFRYFLKSIGMFCIIGCLLLGGMTVYARKYMLAAYQSDVFSLGKGITTIIFGDSHTQCALNPDLMPGSVNISKSREICFYSYYKLLKFLDTNPNIRVVIFSFSYHNIARLNHERILHEPKTVETYLPLLDDKGLEFAKSDAKSYLLPYLINYGLPVNIYNNKLLIKSILGKKLQKSDFPFIEGFHPSKNSNINISEMEKIIASQYLDSRRNYSGKSEIMLDYFDKIMSLCKNRGIRVYLFNGPLHRSYKERTPVEAITSFISVKDQILKKYPNTVYLDYSDYPLEDYCYGDGDHVNYYGSVIITNDLTKKYGKLINNNISDRK